MKRLLPIALLAGAIVGVMAYRHAPRPSATTPVGANPAVTVSSPVFPPAPPTPAGATTSPSPANLLTEVTRALRHGSAVERDRALNALLPRLVAQDPAAAGHLALAWESGALRDELLRQVIRLWAETDLGGAITWLTSLLEPTDRHLAAAAAVAQVGQTDRAGSLELAQLLQVGLDDGSLEHWVQLWTEDEPRAAVNWVLTQPDGPIRDRLLARVAWTLK